MTRTEVRFRGVGGQGIITMGYIIGRAAAIYDKRKVYMSEFYGPEITGGFARTDVIIQDEEIDYPLIDHPNYFVAMSQDAWEDDGSSLRDDGVIIHEKDLVKIHEGEKRKLMTVPAIETADELGRRVVANVVMMGAVQEITQVVTKESLEKALLDRVPKGTEDLNISALKKGYEIGKKLVEGGGN
ncbi:MAG: 2-oxoacid:acceptor oxidoreductase family protein [Candidatus Kariarchaeaceae archaeon]|jgi:2-oxoglutarate ferredoxin oxidoreductase subunit gamma